MKGEEVIQPGVPESFHVLLKELQGLGLSVELLNEDIERFTQVQNQAYEMSATLGAPLNWDDLSDEPLDVLDIEELPGGELPLPANSAGNDAGGEESESDEDNDSNSEPSEPSEDSLQALASEESSDAEGSIPGVDDEEN